MNYFRVVSNEKIQVKLCNFDSLIFDFLSRILDKEDTLLTNKFSIHCDSIKDDYKYSTAVSLIKFEFSH